MFERFDHDALRAIVLSQDAARALDRAEIGTEHLLAGLVGEEWFVAAQLLTALGIPSFDVRAAIRLPEPTGNQPPMARHLPLDRSLKHVLREAPSEANQLGSETVGTEHLLLSLLRSGKGDGAAFLRSKGITHPGTLTWLRANPEDQRSGPAGDGHGDPRRDHGDDG